MNLSTNAIVKKGIVIFVIHYPILFVKIVVIINKEVWLCINHWQEHTINHTIKHR